MAWNDLEYPFGSKLTSSKMTQLFDDLAAMAAGDVGAPSIVNAALGTDSVQSAQIQANAVDTSEIAASAVEQNELAALAVGQGELKTTSGIVSTASTSATRLTLPGGDYGFYPRTRASTNTSQTRVAAMLAGTFNIGTSYVTNIVMSSSGDTVYAQQTYVQASPPYDLGDGVIPLFVFALIDSNNTIIAIYSAPEAPWHYNGPTDIRGAKVRKRDMAGFDPMDFEKGDVIYTRKPTTQNIKNADMGLIPHPFMGNDLTGKSVILVDPVSDTTWKMADYFAGHMYALHDLFYNGDIVIDNTPLNRKGPEGVLCCSVRLK